VVPSDLGMSAYVSVFDRLSRTETRSSAMKKPALNADFRCPNTSTHSVSSIRSNTSRNTTRTSSSRMTTRTAPVSSSLFNRLAETETYASAQMKGKIEAEPQQRSSGKTTNSFFSRMAQADTYASANMKGSARSKVKSNKARTDETANDAFFNRMATEDTYATASMKGLSEKKVARPKCTRKTSNAFFSRMAVSDTFASATMKGKIEPSPNNDPSPSPRKAKTKTNSSFFDRLSKAETSSSRRRKMCYGEDIQEGDNEIRWDSRNNSNVVRPTSAKSVTTSKSSRTLGSRLSLLSTKSTGVLSRKKLFRRAKSSGPSDTTASRSNLMNQKSPKSPRRKTEITISKSEYNVKSNSSVRSSGSIKSKASAKSKSSRSLKSSRSIKSVRTATSRTSATSRSSATSRTSETTSSNRNLRESRPSPTSKSFTSTRSTVKKTPPPPRKPVAPLIFDSDEDMSFGSDDDDEHDILNGDTPAPKENDSTKENRQIQEDPKKSLNELAAPAPVQDMVMTESEEDAFPVDNGRQSPTRVLTLPNESEPESPPPKIDVPQDKPVVIDETMLSFDESFDNEDEDDDLDMLLGPPENDSPDDSLENESHDDDDFSSVEKETPDLEEEQKMPEDSSMDTTAKLSKSSGDTSAKQCKFKLLLSDKYHPENDWQELDVVDLKLVDSLVSFESNEFSNERLSVLIIEALFRRDFKDGDHWEVDPGTAREAEDDEMDGRDLDGRAFVVKQQARWDSEKHYSVAAAKGTVTIWPETDEIRMENYSYFVAG